MKLTISNQKIKQQEKSYELFLSVGVDCIYVKLRALNNDEWFVLAIHEDGTFERCGGLLVPEFKIDKNLKILESIKET